MTRVIADAVVQLRASVSHGRRLADDKRQFKLDLASIQAELDTKSALVATSQEDSAEFQTRVDALEEELARRVSDSESLERQLKELRQQFDASVAAVDSGTSQVKYALALVQEDLVAKSAALHASESAKNELSNELHALHEEVAKKVVRVEELEQRVEEMQRESGTNAMELQNNADQAQQAILALASVQVQLMRLSASLASSSQVKGELERELSILQDAYTNAVANGQRLEQSVQDLRQQVGIATAAHKGVNRDMCQAIVALAVSHAELRSTSASLVASDKAKVDLLSHFNASQGAFKTKVAEVARLEQQLTDLRERSNANAVAESQSMDQLRAQHMEEINDLQQMLAGASLELEDTKKRHLDVENRLHQSMEQASRSKVDLEARLAAMLECAQAGDQLEEELNRTRTEHATETSRLKEEVRRADEDLQGAIRAHAEIKTLHQDALAQVTQSKEDYEAQLSRVTQQSLETTQQLEESLAVAGSKHIENVGELERQLKQVVEEVGKLQVRLRDEVDVREQERRDHATELQAKAEQCRRAESLETELHQEIATTRTQLDQTRTALEALEADRRTLQTEATSLTAEIQRTVSLNRYLENEMKSW